MKKKPFRNKKGGGVKLNLCREYLDQKQYRSLPTQTLAGLIYEKNKALFTNKEAVRSALKFLRGASGKAGREKYKEDVAKYEKYSPKDLAPYAEMPRAKKHFKDWKPYEITCEKMLILSDAHIPYHDAEALEAALAIGEDAEVDCVLLNGDWADCFSVSFWEKDPSKRDFGQEIEDVLQSLEHLRGRFPDQQIVWKLGNHEERYIRYMTMKAPELLGVPKFKFENIFEFDQFGIDLVDGKMPIQFQDYTIVHGHEFWGGGGVFPAKSFFQKTKVNTISAHLHRSTFYSEKDVHGGVKRSYSMGCLADLKTDYSPMNPWDHSCIVIERGKKGAKVTNHVIEDGEIV